MITQSLSRKNCSTLISTEANTHTHARTHARTHTHTYTHTHAHPRTHAHADKHKEKHTHTHTRTHASRICGVETDGTKNKPSEIFNLVTQKERLVCMCVCVLVCVRVCVCMFHHLACPNRQHQDDTEHDIISSDANCGSVYRKSPRLRNQGYLWRLFSDL